MSIAFDADAWTDRAVGDALQSHHALLRADFEERHAAELDAFLAARRLPKSRLALGVDGDDLDRLARKDAVWLEVDASWAWPLSGVAAEGIGARVRRALAAVDTDAWRAEVEEAFFAALPGIDPDRYYEEFEPILAVHLSDGARDLLALRLADRDGGFAAFWYEFWYEAAAVEAWLRVADRLPTELAAALRSETAA